MLHNPILLKNEFNFHNLQIYPNNMVVMFIYLFLKVSQYPKVKQ